MMAEQNGDGMSYDPRPGINRAMEKERELCYAYKDELDKLRSDRATVLAWMREPDYVENASLEWLTDWINRRPISSSS